MWKLGIIFAETAEGQRETGLFHIYTYGKKQEGQNRTGQWVFSPDVENFCGLSTENPVWITRRGEMWKARTAALLGDCPAFGRFQASSGLCQSSGLCLKSK